MRDVWTFVTLAVAAVAAPSGRFNDLLSKNASEGFDHNIEGYEQSAPEYQPRSSSSSSSCTESTTKVAASGYARRSSTFLGNTTSIGFSTIHLPRPYNQPTTVASIPASEDTVTKTTTIYTTIGHATTTAVRDGTTEITTYATTSTITSIYSNPSSSNAYETPVSWSTVPWGTSYISYPVPSYPSTTSNRATQPTRPVYSPTTSGFLPAPTDNCVPCKGQPGNDPDSYCGYTINDDWMKVTPITCRTREYTLKVTNTTIAPDGIERLALLVNGQMPGPTIEASWGDTIVVHLENQMQNNGTSIHFHGIRQYFTNEMDGVPSITQCALAPGESFTYSFTATNYGSSWYHSHFALQTYEGVFGPVVIHGPSALQYDEEQIVIVQDWSHATVDAMYQAAQTVGTEPDHGPRTLDTGLINGMNIWGVDGAANATGEQTEGCLQSLSSITPISNTYAYLPYFNFR